MIILKTRAKVAALKWLHHFMGHFGADNNQVTLAGCSAGGGSQEWSSTIFYFIFSYFDKYFKT